MTKAVAFEEFEIPAGIARYVNVPLVGEAAKRAKAVRRLRIPHLRFQEGLEALLAHHMMFDPAGSESSVLMFAGKTGAGKSRTLRHYANQFPLIETETGVVRRVLYVHVPPGVDRYSIQRRMMAALGTPVLGRIHPDQLSLAIDLQLVEQKVELIIFDESNHMVDMRTNKTQFLVADVVKEFTNWNNGQIVIAGLMSSLMIVEVNLQLHRRVSGRFEVKQYSWHEEGDQKEFLNFIAEVADQLSWFARRPPLDDKKDLGWRIHLATAGLVGLVIVLTAKAVEIATRLEASNLERAHLADAFDVLKPVGTIGNPFSSGRPNVKFPDGFEAIFDRNPDETSTVRRELVP
ncbi:TniB family NTP-binding protein [Mesorhizobium sp. VK25A]|uniref:TniB family NTP-binding protein n=1 Tax=Mesorhizobium vachelliae TaxID=3072309 RepID=A0ABU4ZWI4_9HYPH|nr:MULTISPECIES: TniB family NTP-binding protein [unclassified Mesorhizobium]MDX8529776.1 TniB family NTP-binding protein [Mesorhizobium sp. VK25D]MDX8544174.1 TniB family NTP-binding protein [Mesorhizobium sp. VK25A]